MDETEIVRLEIVTLFPDMFSSFLAESILARTIRQGQLEVVLHDPRSFAQNKHGRVDDRPYGGGPGMVLSPQPWVDCIEQIRSQGADPGHLVLFTPVGQQLHQRKVETLVKNKRLIMVCGRYEGFDQRIIDILQPEEISIGDYIINGGEVAAMVMVEATMRLLPGALGDQDSARQDSFSSENRILEFPQYTRPSDFRGQEVPPVLLSGNHAAIEAWRAEQSRLRTAQRRSELLDTNDFPREATSAEESDRHQIKDEDRPKGCDA